jgi:hypothetical protein
MKADNWLPDSYVPIKNVSFSQRLDVINGKFIPKNDIYIHITENNFGWKRVEYHTNVVFEYDIAISGRDFQLLHTQNNK